MLFSFIISPIVFAGSYFGISDLDLNYNKTFFVLVCVYIIMSFIVLISVYWLIFTFLKRHLIKLCDFFSFQAIKFFYFFLCFYLSCFSGFQFPQKLKTPERLTLPVLLTFNLAFNTTRTIHFSSAIHIFSRSYKVRIKISVDM